MNEEVGVGACGKPALWFSKQRWTGSHGCGSVHAVVELREGVRDLHHLTGHYHGVPYGQGGSRRRLEARQAPQSRKKDAVVSLAMALDGAIRQPLHAGSVYDQRGIKFFEFF